MGEQRLPAAGILLAAFLVFSASVLSLPAAHKDAGKRAEALSPEAARGQKSPKVPSVLMKSRSESSVTQRADRALAPGSLKIIAVSQSWVSAIYGSGKNFKARGSYATVQAPASASLRAPVTPRPTQESARAPRAPATPAPMSAPPQPPAWLSESDILSPGPQTPSASRAGLFGIEDSPLLTLAPRGTGKVVSPASLGHLESASMATTTQSLPPAAPGWSWLDMSSPAFTAGSGPPRAAVTSGLGPSDPIVLPPWPSLPSSPSPSSISLKLSLSPVLTPVSSVTTRTRSPPAHPMSALAPSATDSALNTFTAALPSLMVPQSATPGGTVQGSDSPWIPAGAAPTQSSTLSHPGQVVSLQDSVSSPPEPNLITHSVTFRIATKPFSVTPQNPVSSQEGLLLSECIRQELQSIYHKAFPSFQSACVLEFRPGSVAVNVSLVFWSLSPVPSAGEVLWTLYRQVKASRGMLGHLFLDESSLTAAGSTLTNLALETVSISFTAMKPFMPQLLQPSSVSFALLEEHILHLVTPVVTAFYKEHPQKGPLLLFSNEDQWVSVYMEYKFQNPIPTHLGSLANHLAHNITDPILQISSIVANGEKAELALYEMWLQILSQPFTTALEDKTRPESRKLRQQLTKWLTKGLRPLKNFGQVVVEKFQSEPLTAKVGAIFFGATPAPTLIQHCVHQARYFLQKREGLWVEMVTPDLGTPSSGASCQSGVPSSALLILNLLLVTLFLFPVLKSKACFRVSSLGDQNVRQQ